MIDLVSEFTKYEKKMVQYFKDRIQNYDRTKIKKSLFDRMDRMNASWDMQVGATRKSGNRRHNQHTFLAQMSYPLVKKQILIRRALFTSNFRANPIFTVKAIGNTPMENAVNMQDLLTNNNDQIKFRPKVLVPSIDWTCKYGASVVFSEYNETNIQGWRTVADPVMGSDRVFGTIKQTKNAQCYMVDPRNYFQNPDVVDSDESDYRGHRERRTLAWLIQRVKTHPDLYIKENVEKVIKQVKADNQLDKEFYDPHGRHSKKDFNQIAINDVIRAQFQVHIRGNEDDSTYYYIEMIGDTIIRFQDNPYDMNMNQWTVLTMEPRHDAWWGNTPAEYSIGNENALNFLLGMDLENTIESMRRYIFYNKHAISPSDWQRAATSGKIAVDVSKDVNLNNLLFSWQVPDSSSNSVGNSYARILENDQRVSTNPDLSRPTSQGGPSNKTATAASIIANEGDVMDADILERYSYCLSRVGEKQQIILAQFLGNWGPVLIRPNEKDSIRMVQKANFIGNYTLSTATAFQSTHQSEMVRYQNIVTWLLNMVNSGASVQPNMPHLIKQVLKMGEFKDVDEIIPEQQQVQQPGFQPTQVVLGQELAGAGQEILPPGVTEQGQMQ